MNRLRLFHQTLNKIYELLDKHLKDDDKTAKWVLEIKQELAELDHIQKEIIHDLFVDIIYANADLTNGIQNKLDEFKEKLDKTKYFYSNAGRTA